MTGSRQPFLPVLSRFVRLQFAPVMIGPVVLGAAFAWHATHAFEPALFALTLLGSVSLLLAANGIDDVYDQLNGVDATADRLFPKEFPGWKPITRGVISVRDGFVISGFFYALSVGIGLYLSAVVGWLAIGIALPGILLSFFYTAPPLKLDYRGLGLGELSILLSFGPIPCLGAYYVLTGGVSIIPVAASVSTGLLTVNVLMMHDLIFFEPYRQAGKRSLAVVLGAEKTQTLVLWFAALAYLMIIAAVAAGLVPLTGLLCVAAVPLLLWSRGRVPDGQPPPQVFATRTMRTFSHTLAFTLLLAIGLLLG
ncbi:MAG TPA: prenyltransferase [Nitrososphaerales archaeon]|nr:prenyltransferase [Nitrososphaerales archaeon]